MIDLLHLFASRGGQLALAGLLALAGFFLIGLCLASLASHGKREGSSFPRWRWFRRSAQPTLSLADRKGIRADEDLLAKEGIFVTLDRLGPDERDLSRTLARQRDIHRG